MMVRAAGREDADAWAAMRSALWPDGSFAKHRDEAWAMLDSVPDKAAVFLALDHAGSPVGFAESALRHDYVNGCATSPVAFLEGIYVDPGHRSRGVGKSLAMAVQGWARERGCTELASDALLENHASHAFHLALGFAETERVVYFRQAL